MRTLGYLLFALQVQPQSEDPLQRSSTSVITLLANSTPVAKAVLLILALFSIISWGIVLYKAWTFRRATRHTTQFIDVFRRSNKFSEVQAVCRSLSDSPLVGLFQAGYAELTGQLRQNTPDVANGPNPRSAADRPTLKSLTAVDRALMRAASIEVNKLEHWVPFLATTASISPFIGLFGTVWGILIAFEDIGRMGSTNLNVVAPGIAEALITTAFGLAAAIPAVLFYNYFSQRVKMFATSMDDFAMEFLNIAERNFT